MMSRASINLNNGRFDTSFAVCLCYCKLNVLHSRIPFLPPTHACKGANLVSLVCWEESMNFSFFCAAYPSKRGVHLNHFCKLNTSVSFVGPGIIPFQVAFLKLSPGCFRLPTLCHGWLPCQFKYVGKLWKLLELAADQKWLLPSCYGDHGGPVSGCHGKPASECEVPSSPRATSNLSSSGTLLSFLTVRLSLVIEVVLWLARQG